MEQSAAWLMAVLNITSPFNEKCQHICKKAHNRTILCRGDSLTRCGLEGFFFVHACRAQQCPLAFFTHVNTFIETNDLNNQLKLT